MPGKTEQLRTREKSLYRLMVITELRAMTLIKNEYHAFVAKRFQLFFVGGFALLLVFITVLAVFIQSQTKLLDSCYNNLIRVIIGKKPVNQGTCVGIFFNTPFLEPIELLPRLPIKVFAVYNENAFFNVGVIF